MSAMPPGIELVEVIGRPGIGWKRQDDPTLPSVVFTGDEALHLWAIASAATLGGQVHDTGRLLDPDCEGCRAIAAKIDELTKAANGP